jgi:hypothetical protein
MLVPEAPHTNGHAVVPADVSSNALADRYAAGATLDELAVEFHMPPSRCPRLLLESGVELRVSRASRSAEWFDPSAIPLERQREIAEAYRAFAGYEVAAAYGIPLPWVEKIAHLYGVRKAAPRGYRKRRTRSAGGAVTSVAPHAYRATLVVEAQIEAGTWEAAVAQLRQASPAIQVLRVSAVQRLVAVTPQRQL